MNISLRLLRARFPISVAVLGLASSSLAASPAYTITDLGTLGGGNAWSVASSINASGQVVGTWGAPGGSGGSFLWSNGAMTDLGNVSPNSINLYGQVAGDMNSSSATHGVIWSNGQFTDLGTLGGRNSDAYGINNSEQVAGASWTANGSTDAFLWSNGLMTDLGSGRGLAINSSGQVVGDRYGHAFMWGNGTATDLGTLGGLTSTALSINDSGQVVGSSYTPTSSSGNTYHAFIWQNGLMTDLNAPGWLNSNAYSINNNGEVLGSFTTASGYGLFLWSNGATTDLSSLVTNGSAWKLNTAYSINDAGQIVGGGDINGQTHAYLLTAVPEPKTYSMFLAGLGLLGFIAQRKAALESVKYQKTKE